MTAWLIAGLAVGTFALRFAGAAVSGALSPRLARAVALLPIAMLAALVAVQTFQSPGGLGVSPRALGVAAAAVALWLRAPFVAVVVVAAAVCAAARWLLF